MARNKSTSGALLNGLLLKPLSAVYGAVTGVRNKMFDMGVLTQREFDIPVIVVGNIAVGGTGKTPHTEYIIELLHERYHIGVLSRGYNRRTKGFILADDKADARRIGDEPYQIYSKFKDKGVTVAVCEDRCHGIDRMREIDPAIDLIVLDDAFQHRYVKPSVSIVLTEYARPVFTDSMLPAGRLREGIGALHRADIVIVTKCPANMKPMEYRLFVKHLELYPFQKLYFSRYAYDELRPVFPESGGGRAPRLNTLTEEDTIITLAGVANPRPLVRHLRSYRAKVKGMIFNDHHNFTLDDIAALIKKIKSLPDPGRTIIVTTEKDSMRLRALQGIPKAIKARLYYQPISVKIIPNMADSNQAGAREFAGDLMELLAKHGAGKQ